MKWSPALIVLALLLGFWSAQAEKPDEHYLRILKMIEQAESYNTNTQAKLALAKYQQAQAALRDFQKINPTWNTRVVSYRTKNLAEQVAALSAKISAPAESSEVTVTLLRAGAEPRKILRLHPKPGDKQTLSMTMKMAIEMKMGDAGMPAMKMPAMTMVMDATVKSVSAEGDITYDTVISDASVAEDPEVLPQVAEAVKASFNTIKGLTGSGVISSHGISKGTDIKVPAGADPQMRQTMEQMKQSFSQVALPFPEEAVGAGAKWEVKTPITSQGMTISQTANYELVSLEAERLTAKSTVSQSAANQKVQNPAMPGVKLDLKKMTGTATGEVTTDLAKLLPAQGTVESHSDMSMEMNMGGQKQAMNMKVDLNLHLEAK